MADNTYDRFDSAAVNPYDQFDSGRTASTSAAPVTPAHVPTLNDFDPGKALLEPALAIGSGMVAQPIGGLAGLAAAALPGETGQGARVSERVADALTYEPRTSTGRLLTNVATLPGRAIEYVAGKVGERGAQVSPALGAAGKASTEILPVLLGARAGVRPRTPLTPRQQEVAAARDAGFKMTPEEMGAGPVPRTVASLAGEPRLAKLTSKQNVAIGNRMISEDLGLPRETKLSREVTEEIREREGKAYDAMRKAGTVTKDETFSAEVESSVRELRAASRDFPHREKSSLLGVADSLTSKATADANSLVSEIINLRDDAKAAFKRGEAQTGRANLQMADAIEGLLDRHVERMSATNEFGGRQIDPASMQAFRQARVRIAKSYAADKAMNPTTGDINPQAYAKMLQNRVPLSGQSRRLGEFAQAFERSSQRPSHQATAATVHDAALGMLARAAHTGGKSILLDILALGARPLARYGLASRIGQTMMDPRTTLHAREALGVTGFPRDQENQQNAR